MNDLDLNKAVAEKLGFEVLGSSELISGYVGGDVENAGYMVKTKKDDYIQWHNFLSWQDAGPIIEKYKIDLTHVDGNCYASVSGESELVITDDESALKAAMLCFLEMEI